MGGAVSTHKKHTGRYKGLNPAFGAACVRELLEPAGIDHDTARQLQIRLTQQLGAASSAGGEASSAKAAPASSSSSDDDAPRGGAGRPGEDGLVPNPTKSSGKGKKS